MILDTTFDHYSEHENYSCDLKSHWSVLKYHSCDLQGQFSDLKCLNIIIVNTTAPLMALDTTFDHNCEHEYQLSDLEISLR